VKVIPAELVIHAETEDEADRILAEMKKFVWRLDVTVSRSKYERKTHSVEILLKEVE
jgi:hypothetical protein